MRDAIIKIKKERYFCNHIVEMDIIALAHKRDMNYDFYMKHIMHAVEWKLNQVISKNKTMISKLPATWVHPLNRKNECYRV